MIWCLGDLMVDVVASLSGPLAEGSDTPASIVTRGGGSAANTAAWLGSTGSPVTFIGCVGSDSSGDFALTTLPAVSLCVRRSDRPTGTCLVLVAPDGERTMVPDPGANADLTAADLPSFGAADHLHVSGYALTRDSRLAAVAALGAARDAGATVSVGAGSAAPLQALGAEKFFAAVGSALVFANADEARVLVGSADLAEAARLLAARTGEAVVTAGARGAAWSDGSRSEVVVPRHVDVLDSTGAGDAFTAGFLASRSAGVREALAGGHRLAGLACTRAGGRP